MYPRQTKIYTVLFLIVVIIYCFVRDTHIEAQYCGDLRNRIVGARLQLDKQLPYFYKWQAKDGLRYYDPQNFDSLRVANITASPFMHELLYPLAELPQRDISFIWLICEYLMLIIMLLLALQLCKTNRQLIATTIISSLFLFTNSWIQHIAGGQIYLILPFLSMLFYVFIKSKYRISIFFAGLCAIALIAIRPTYLFFFIPFLLMIIKFKWQQILVFFLAPMLLIGYIVCNKQERLFWQDYKNGITEQLKLHQDLSPVKQINTISPNLRFWEGYDMEAVKVTVSKYPLEIKTLNNNFFIIYKSIFHKKIAAGDLNFISLALILVLFSFMLYKSGITYVPSVTTIALFSFSCYMLSDFLSPIHRHQYNAVVWLFPLLVVAINYKKNWALFTIILLICLIANITIFSSIVLYKFSEYLIWLIIMIVSFTELNILKRYKG